MAEMNNKLQLSILIVSWNVREHLKRCLQAIYQHTSGIDFEVIVVDNASNDGSADMVAKEFSQVQLVRNLKNRGFAAANNQVIKLAKGEYILFLNDDTEITSNIFKTLLDKYQALDSAIGMLGCRLLNPDGAQQASVRKLPTIFDQTVILLKLQHLFPKLLTKYWQSNFNYQQEQIVEQVMGAFMFMPKVVLDKIGYFDERFFNWFEEVDLQKRLQEQHYKILYTPIVSCIHVKGPSFKQLSKPAAQKMFNASMLSYFKKHHSVLAVIWLGILWPFSILLAYALNFFR
ncbi:MAG: glycosyltransferase family 2 protein [Patescibacteria group bacterium]|jgi:hypothetical protein